jgi:CspA family cold shock protein
MERTTRLWNILSSLRTTVIPMGRSGRGTSDGGWAAMRAQAIDGVVQSFDAEEGWGVISAPEVPGGCFVHFSDIHMAGYRCPAAGERVKFTFEKPPGLQDGYAYRALEVWLTPLRDG